MKHIVSFLRRQGLRRNESGIIQLFRSGLFDRVPLYYELLALADTKLLDDVCWYYY
jgi:hypothetical protein